MSELTVTPAHIVPATIAVLQRTPVLHQLPAQTQQELAESLQRKLDVPSFVDLRLNRADFYWQLVAAARKTILFSVLSDEPLQELIREITDTAFSLPLHAGTHDTE